MKLARIAYLSIRWSVRYVRINSIKWRRNALTPRLQKISAVPGKIQHISNTFGGALHLTHAHEERKSRHPSLFAFKRVHEFARSSHMPCLGISRIGFRYSRAKNLETRRFTHSPLHARAPDISGTKQMANVPHVHRGYAWTRMHTHSRKRTHIPSIEQVRKFNRRDRL